jgi:hypothetical protein
MDLQHRARQRSIELIDHSQQLRRVSQVIRGQAAQLRVEATAQLQRLRRLITPSATPSSGVSLPPPFP